MDTRKYVVEFSDGSAEQYYANVIAENALSGLDSQGRELMLIESISDHKVDTSVVTL